MALETTTTEPKLEDFTPLSDHQEQTPTAFYGAKPVLHLRSPNASVSVSVKDTQAQPALKALASDMLESAHQEMARRGEDLTNATNTIPGLDIWVSSKHLTIFSPDRNYGVHIPYQSIVVHAAEGETVLLGLNLSERDTPDEDMSFVQLRLTPKKPYANGTEGTEQPNGVGGGTDLALFNAISACQELNPDPPEEGDEEGFDETAPGATGWITSENMADFMDENGEFKMPEGATVIGDEGADDANGTNGLGEGAGRTRTAAEVDAEDGVEDEAKWQRTG